MTDQLQKTFKDAYTKQLIDGVKTGRTLPQYQTGDFELDETRFTHIAGIYTPEGLAQKMIAVSIGKDKHCVEAAILLFEAYRNLSPLIASSESFWAYLCHTELKDFVRFDWPFEAAKNQKNYVLNHYFFGIDYGRNALASLWWSVYLTYDQDRKDNGKDPYELTRIFFKNYSFRVIWLKVILRIHNALHGILEYLLAHPEVMESNFENRILFISKYFNMLGATKQLSILPKSYFVNELEQMHSTILAIRGRGDVSNKSAMAILDAAQKDNLDDSED